MGNLRVQIDELLDLAFVRTHDKGTARKALEIAIEGARASVHLELQSKRFHKQDTTKQRAKLAQRIEETLECLQRVRLHWDDVAIAFQPVGSGVIDVATLQEMIRGRALDLPRNPSISDGELLFPTITEVTAMVNVELLLRALLLRLRLRQKPRGQKGRGRRADLAAEGIVFYAMGFFEKHSFVPASADERKRDNPLHPFVERFYEIVTGNRADVGSLDWYIRKTFTEKLIRQKSTN